MLPWIPALRFRPATAPKTCPGSEPRESFILRPGMKGARPFLPAAQAACPARTCPQGQLATPRLQLIEIFLGFQRRHAAKACSCYGLTIKIIGHVSRREHAGNIGFGAVGFSDEIFIGLHVELADKQLG